MQRVALGKDVTAALRAGHPWIYQRALADVPHNLHPGDVVEVVHRGRAVAVGYVDPGAPIAVRVLDVPGTRIDEAWAAERVRRAVTARQSHPLLADTDAMRLVHGENDYLPGLVVDRYADVAIAAYDGRGAAALWRRLRGGVAAALPGGVAAVERADAPAHDVAIREAGAVFLVDLRRGQKTGLFLDQRDNRRRVRAIAAGARVLNLFCYTGGFSIQAALGGAAEVVSVDQAAPAVAAAHRNLAANGLSVADHELCAEDAFGFLVRETRRGRRWDIVVCDPPSFAPSERARPRALAAYRRLNRLAIDAVERSGTLVTASCSSHVTVRDLAEVVAAAAADAGRGVRVIGEHGAAGDHPTRPGFREGHYLGCLFVALD